MVVDPDRVAAWQALAELYLDVEHDDAALRAIARALAPLPYSLPELREIERWEVAPVVLPNLRSVAGVWTGFDPTWLEAECRRRTKRGALSRGLRRVLGWRGAVQRATGAYWERLAPLLREERVTLSRTAR